MKTKILVILSAIVLILGAMLGIQSVSLSKERENAQIYKGNIDALMKDIEVYRTKDSMSVAKTSALELKISEFEEYCKEQNAIIKKLKVNKKELESIVSTQMETIYSLSGQSRDTVITYVDRVQIDTVTKIAYSDKWIDLDLILHKNGSFDGNIETRDNLHVVESVEYKRFLGFLWRTSKVKKRDVNVVSESPYATINNVSYVEIRK